VIWVKTQGGSLVNLSNVQGINITCWGDESWWIVLDGVKLWGIGNAWLGPYRTMDLAKGDLQTIES
jgi:hypothetical protein